MADAKRQAKAFCNECSGETNHDLLYEHRCTDVPDNGVPPKEVVWHFLKCRGCGSVKAKTSEWYPGMEYPHILHFPPVERRKQPKWSQTLPKEIQELQSEVYSAIHTASLRLATIGARTLLDMAIVKSVGDVGTFAQKLDMMVARGHLASKKRYVLEAALEIGSATSHRGHNPNFAELETAMDIVEHLLEEVFYFPESAKGLKQAIPPRKRNQKLGK